MKEPINPKEFRFLAVIILSGLCANSHYSYSPEFHVVESVKLLTRLLTTLDKPDRKSVV